MPQRHLRQVSSLAVRKPPTPTLIATLFYEDGRGHYPSAKIILRATGIFGALRQHLPLSPTGFINFHNATPRRRRLQSHHFCFTGAAVFLNPEAASKSHGMGVLLKVFCPSLRSRSSDSSHEQRPPDRHEDRRDDRCKNRRGDRRGDRRKGRRESHSHRNDRLQ